MPRPGAKGGQYTGEVPQTSFFTSTIGFPFVALSLDLLFAISLLIFSFSSFSTSSASLRYVSAGGGIRPSRYSNSGLPGSIKPNARLYYWLKRAMLSLVPGTLSTYIGKSPYLLARPMFFHEWCHFIYHACASHTVVPSQHRIFSTIPCIIQTAKSSTPKLCTSPPQEPSSL